MKAKIKSIIADFLAVAILVAMRVRQFWKG